MFSAAVKFENRPFVMFNVVCWGVLIQHYQMVFQNIIPEQPAVWWSSGQLAG